MNAEKSDKMISLGYLKYQSVYVFTIMSYTCIYIKTNPTRVWTYKVSIRSFWDICFFLYILYIYYYSKEARGIVRGMGEEKSNSLGHFRIKSHKITRFNMWMS